MSNQLKREMSKIDIPDELNERCQRGIQRAKLKLRNPKRHWSLIVAPVAACLMAAMFFFPVFFTNHPSENPEIRTMTQSNAFDVSNTRKLVGWSDNVFIGKVFEKVGTKSPLSYPETQFKVKVLKNIKGSFNGTIKVNQQGGYEGNKLYLIQGDQLLKEGQTYLFVTKHSERFNWNTLVPVYGDIPINSKEEKAKLIENYTKAYKNEIPFKRGSQNADTGEK
ncbi:MAG TPA: hypothetical protein VFK44_03275 [Bacillales bacterium]|nr:hypothetical protein [Bacillales bacterium]